MAVTHKTAIKVYEHTDRLPLIDAAAKAAGCSRAELYRRAMKRYLDRKGKADGNRETHHIQSTHEGL